MKNIFIIIIAIVSVAIFSVSCDKIEGSYTEEISTEGNESDTIRKVLLEDYTGHTCPNCPLAHTVIDDLHDRYGDRMVTVAIHTGTFADPLMGGEYGAYYKSADGEVLSTFFGGNSAPLPRGIVNRAKVNGDFLIEKGEFATEVSKVLDGKDNWPDLYLEVKPTYTDGNTFDVEVKITAMIDMPAGKYNLSVLITESDIVSPQYNTDLSINNGQNILDYHHNYMLRAAVNSPWGEEFAVSITKGETFTKTYTSVPLDANWVADNISIVAFAYYADGAQEKEVIQAETEHLK